MVPSGARGPAAGPDLADLAAHFTARLRDAGLPVGPQRSARFAAAVDRVHPLTTTELYWCARITLVADPAELPAFDRVFGDVFGASPGPRPPVPPRLPGPAPRASARDAVPSTQDDQTRDGDEETYRALASAAERLAERDFATLTPAELAELIVLMRRMRLVTPLRLSRRYQAGARGPRVDLRGTLRRAQRSGGFPARLAYRRQRVRRRRLVVLCDISGSMGPYARAMIQLLYSAVAVGARTEVFTFATRLTRLTRALRRVRPEVALARAGRAAPDWQGGTRIGEALRVFLARYGARGMARGAVVLVISDGWETGDAAQLGRQMARLHRLAYRVVWANPRTAAPNYQPLVAGMAAAWPYCDAVVSAHSLRAVGPLLDALAADRTGRVSQPARALAVDRRG